MPVVHDLQQYAPDVLVRLFDLVEQHHRPGLTAHLFGELAAVLVADVARGRADELAYGVLFHVFGHIQSYHSVGLAVNGLGKRAAQLRLAHARGAEEQEAADWPVGV